MRLGCVRDAVAHSGGGGGGADLSKLTLAKRADIPHETNVAKNAQASGDHSWSNPDTKETYMKMYNEYHRLRSGYDTCHGCRFLPALYKTYRCVRAVCSRPQFSKRVPARAALLSARSPDETVVGWGGAAQL